MLVYRIDSDRRAENPITGLGAKLYGGRWNEIGIPAVYAAQHRSLAMLETLAHVKKTQVFPHNRMIFTILVPDEHIHKIPNNQLRKGWNDITTYGNTDHIMRTMMVDQKKLALLVPSVIVQEEYNIIIDPGHLGFETVRVVDQKMVEWDRRMFKTD